MNIHCTLDGYNLCYNLAPVSFEVMNRLDNGMMDWLICFFFFGWVDGFQKAKDLETADLLNRMPTPQVVRILVEAYQNSEYAMAAKLRIQEILQTVRNVYYLEELYVIKDLGF
jgi:hypothetical protein